MRKISLLQQILGRHGPQHWFSGLLAFLICLVNVFSVVGIGFALPASQAASLAHSTRSTQSAQQALQQGLHAQVSTQKAPQRGLETQAPVKKTIPHKGNAVPHVSLKPHSNMAGALADFTIQNSASVPSAIVGAPVVYTIKLTALTDIPAGASAPGSLGSVVITDTIPVAGLTGITESTDYTGALGIGGGGGVAKPVFVPTYAPVATPTTHVSPLVITITGSNTPATATMGTGDVVIFTISGTVTSTAPVSLTNIAQVSDSALGADPIFATAPSVTVLRPDLTITASAVTPLSQTVNGTISYVLTVHNAGTTATSGTGAITVTDIMPPGLTNITLADSGTTTSWAIVSTAGRVVATYTPLAISAGADLAPTITITATINPTASGTITHTATVAATGVAADDSGNLNNDATGPISVTVTTTPTPTPTPSVTPSVTPTPTLTPTPSPSSTDLTLAASAVTPSSLFVNGNVSYTLTVSNAGTTPTSASGTVKVVDTLPTGLTNTTTAVPNAGNNAWTITNAGNTVTATYPYTSAIVNGVPLATITITATANGAAFDAITHTASVTTTTTTDDTNTANDTASISVTVLRPDLAITQISHAGSTYQVGQSITYTLTVDNNGPLATGSVPMGEVIKVTDTAPASLTGITSAGTGWSFSNTGTTITATNTLTSALAEGASLPVITITGTLSAGSVGTTITNTATVSTPLDIIAAGETEQTSIDTITGVALPDLSTNLAVTNAGCNSVPVSYALTVSDIAGAGPVLSTTAAPTPISVTVTAPANLTSVTLVASTPTDWLIAGLTATYRGVYPVPAGTTLSSITISGTPVAPATSPIVLSAKVSIATGNTTTPTLVDANQANDTATSTFTPCMPNLAIALTHQAGITSFVAGQNVIYSIAVTNTSPVAVPTGSAITVADTLPAGLTNVWAIGSNWSLSITNGTLSGTYVGSYPVATGALPLITVYGTLTSAAGGTINNTATVTTTPATGSPTTSSATDGPVAVTTFTNTPDVAISFVHTGTACVANNGSVTYTLGVTNSATAAILAGQVITVNATLPTNLTGITVSTPGNWVLSFNGNIMTGTYNAPVAISASLPAITIMGNLTNVTAATLTSTATVALANDTNATNNAATDTLTICTPDLAIVKTHDGSGPFKIGTAVTFNLAVTNVGTAPILAGQPITVTDLVPSGISSVTATAATEWTISTLDHTVVATYSGTYPVAPAAILTPILVSGQISSLDEAALTNTATVTTPGDTILTNNTSTDKIPVEALAPDLTVSIDSPNNCVRKNDKASFTFWVSNDSNGGSIAASSLILLTFRVPDGMDQPTFRGSHWTWKKDGSVITATYTHSQTINAGDDLGSFSVTGVVTKSSGGIWLGVRVYAHDDSKRNNDTDYQQFSVC